MADMEPAGSDQDIDEALLDGNTDLQAAEAVSLATPVLSQPALEHLLAHNEPDGDVLLDPAAPRTPVATTPEQQGPVAALVHQFEHLRATSGRPKDHGPGQPHGLASLSVRLAKSPLSSSTKNKKTVLANTGRLKPLQIPGVTVPVDDTDITEPIQALLPAVHGAAARNDAAMAAHRARLHHRGQQQDQWAVASRQTKTRLISTPARQDSLVPPSKLNLDAPGYFSEEDTDLIPEKSSISAAWAQIRSLSPLSGRFSMEASSPRSPRPPLRRCGSVVAPTCSSPRSRPPALTIAEIMRQASVAVPSDLDDSPPWSPTTRQPPAVTVAQIMRQNTRLSPLDFVPPPPSARAPAPLNCRALPVASCTHSFSSGGQSDADPSSQLLTGMSGIDAGPERSGNGEPEHWSHPGAGRHADILLSPVSNGRAPRAVNK